MQKLVKTHLYEIKRESKHGPIAKTEVNNRRQEMDEVRDVFYALVQIAEFVFKSAS